MHFKNCLIEPLLIHALDFHQVEHRVSVFSTHVCGCCIYLSKLLNWITLMVCCATFVQILPRWLTAPLLRNQTHINTAYSQLDPEDNWKTTKPSFSRRFCCPRSIAVDAARACYCLLARYGLVCVIPLYRDTKLHLIWALSFQHDTYNPCSFSCSEN